MRTCDVALLQPGQRLPRQRELAWAIAEVAADSTPPLPEATEVVIDRLIDNTAVAVAALNRAPVRAARAAAMMHPRRCGATVLGMSRETRIDCEWATWANGAAVRELDFHDSFFAREPGHPGDNIPPLLAVAQQCRVDGADLVRGVVTAYEIQVDLAKALNLSRQGIDHVGHLGVATTAGIGAMLRLDAETIYQGVQAAALLSHAPRQTRKGQMSSWKAFAPGHVGMVAIIAIDRAMRGQNSPTPIYEGEYGILGSLLRGTPQHFQVILPEQGEPRRAILETFTKEHSAGYHGQAIIDLAYKLRKRIPAPSSVESILLHTKSFTHVVMGSGSGDPQKYDPEASRETLDHSVMYLFAVALEDGTWHHDLSYAPERARRPSTVALWSRIKTVEVPEWNARFDDRDGLERDHGARAVVVLKDGTVITDEIAVARAHPRGEAPFTRAGYVEKFRALAADAVREAEQMRFVTAAERMPDLPSDSLGNLNVEADLAALGPGKDQCAGLFERGS